MTLSKRIHDVLKEYGAASAADLYEDLDDAVLRGKKASSLERLMRSESDNFREVEGGLFEVVGEWVETPTREPTSSVSTKMTTPARTNPRRRSPQRSLDEADVSAPWRDLEMELRTQLMGRRLVAEIPLDARLIKRIEDVLPNAMRRLGIGPQLASRIPAIIATYLVAHGIYRYDDGTFWSNFGIPRVDNQFGRIFEESASILGLETFEAMLQAEGSHRYVAPILAHGGIPKDRAPEYFELVARAIRYDITDANDLLTELRSDDSWFRSMSGIVRRFLLYGGSLARDFLARTMELTLEWQRSGTILHPDEVGLPAYLISEFRRAVERGEFAHQATRSRRRQDRLTIAVVGDWNESLGVVLQLPAVPPKYRTGRWRILSENHVETHDASAYVDLTVPLRPARHWKIALISDEAVVFERTIEGIDKLPVLLFDRDSGRMISPGLGIRSKAVVTLRPDSISIGLMRRGESIDHQHVHLCDTVGHWAGFTAEEHSLEGATTLLIERPSGSGQTNPRTVTIQTAERPALSGTPLLHAKTDDGLDIYTEGVQLNLPSSSVEWTGTAVIDGESHTLHEEQLLQENLGGLIPNDRLSRISLTVRGPLGSDMRQSFLSVPGLQVHVPNRLVLPGDAETGMRLYSPTVDIEGYSTDRSHAVQLPKDEEFIGFAAMGNNSVESINVTIPRLRWSITDGPTLTFSTSQVTVAGNDFSDMANPMLSLTSGTLATQVEVFLQLHDGSTIAIAANQLTADRTTKFSLRGMSDAISGLHDVAFLRARVGPLKSIVELAAVTAPFLMQVTAVNEVTVDGQRHVQLSFETGRHANKRCAYLWNAGRPWESCELLPIPDDAVSPVHLPIPASVGSGTYILSIGLNDGWTLPQRPTSESVYSSTVTIGDHTAHIEALSIAAPYDASKTLELATLAHRFPMERVTQDHLAPVAEQLLLAWHRERKRRSSNADRSNSALNAMLRIAGPSIIKPVVQLVMNDELDEHDLLCLAIVLASHKQPDPLEVEEVTTLWEIEPALAIMLDGYLDHSAVEDRCRSTLGWGAVDGVKSIDRGEPVDQQWQTIEADQMVSIRSLLQDQLLPRPMTIDGRVDAFFEWLIAAKSERSSDISEWSTRPLITRLYDQTNDTIASFVASASPATCISSWAILPKKTLELSLNVCVAQHQPSHSELFEAAAFCPKQVRRDLILSRILTSHVNQLRRLAEQFNSIETGKESPEC